jgi:hypothetical protein
MTMFGRLPVSQSRDLEHHKHKNDYTRVFPSVVALMYIQIPPTEATGEWVTFAAARLLPPLMRRGPRLRVSKPPSLQATRLGVGCKLPEQKNPTYRRKCDMGYVSVRRNRLECGEARQLAIEYELARH